MTRQHEDGYDYFTEAEDRDERVGTTEAADVDQYERQLDRQGER